jgi:hypothetical protein
LNQKTIIIICGYPKSGTTWLSRLVADMVDCPLLGNWGYAQHESQYAEGAERVSAFECYKSHHPLTRLQNLTRSRDCKLLYIVRDPRDVAISAHYHFKLPHPRLRRLLRHLPGGRFLYGKISTAMNKLTGKQFIKRKLIEAVLHGDKSISGWLAISWHDHTNPFKDAGVLITRYEDLLQQPLSACRRILDHLGIQKSDAAIIRSIENQSFESRKKGLQTQDKYEYRVLRRGGCEYWRTEMSADERKLFLQSLAGELQEYSYSVELE